MADGVNNNIYQGFNDWSQVESMYGNAVTQALQNNNVSLDQVGQVIGSLSSFGGSPAGAGNPNFTGQYDQMAQLINAMGKGGLGGLGGSNQNQQSQATFDPTKSPNYPTSLLGAQALQAVGLNPDKTVTVNPTPGNTPSSSEFNKSGVSAVAGPQTASIQGVPVPQTSVPSLFSPATANQPTTPTGVPPTQQFNAAQMPRGTRGAGTPFATVPPVTSPGAMGPTGVPPAAPASFNAMGGGPNPTRPGLGLWSTSGTPVGGGGPGTTFNPMLGTGPSTTPIVPSPTDVAFKTR